MLSRLREYLVIVLLGTLASVGCILGGLAAPFYFMLYPFFAKGSHVRNVAEAQDRVLAAMYFDCSGRNTVSLEAAFAYRLDQKRLRTIKAALDKADPTHCDNAVINDHSYCPINDHEPGDK